MSMTEEQMRSEYMREMYESEMADLAQKEKTPLIETVERPVLDEMHPDIDWTTRTLYKNFSVDPDAAENFVRMKNPELKTRRDANGTLLVRKPDEDSWRKIDPSTAEWSDISDVGFDLLAGTAETVAAAGGGIAGGTAGLAGGPAAPVTVPAGAMAGASTAGATTAAAMEGLRQKIGTELGVADAYDTDKMKEAALWGGAAPLMFGTGAAGKKVLAQTTEKLMARGMTKEAAAEAAERILKNQRGAIMRVLGPAMKGTGTGIMSVLSGYKPEAIAKLRTMVAQGRMSVDPSSVPRAFVDDIGGAMKAKRELLSKAYGEGLDALDARMNMEAVEKPFRSLLEKYKKIADARSPGFEEALLDPMVDDATKKQLQNLAEVQDYKFLKDQLESYLDQGGYREGRKIVEYMDKINDLSLIRKTTEAAQQAKGKSKVDQDLARVAKQVMSEVDDALGNTPSGEEFKQVKAMYKELIEDEQLAKKFFKDSFAAESTLRNLNSPTQEVRGKAIRELAEKYNIPVEDYADDMFQLSTFGDKALTSTKSVGGSTSTSRTVPASALLGAGGYALGQKVPFLSPFMTAALAGMGGSAIGSPKAMRYMTEMGVRGSNLSQAAQPLQQGAINIWQQMERNQSR